MGEGTTMKKNNAQSLKIPSASWIRNVIKEEVTSQLEEREAARRSPRHDFWDGPPRGEFMEGPMRETKERPMDEKDHWNEWWDGPRPSDRKETSERPSTKRHRSEDENASEKSKRSVWNFWDGDFMSDPIMERPRKARDEEEIEASISPVDTSKARKPKIRGKRK